jgi:AcrR family transcriptional regulator
MGTTVKPMRADAQRNQQRLVSAALAAFTEHGTDDVSLEEIARRAGVGIGTLYRHFPTRQSLLEAVYEGQIEALRAEAEELSASRAPAEALEAWLHAMVGFSATKRSLVSAIMAEIGKESEVVSACSTVVRASVDRLLAQAQAAGEVRADVSSGDVLRLVHAISMTADRATDPSQTGRMIALVVDGLRTQPPAS